jgi:hypothetical protein
MWRTPHGERKLAGAEALVIEAAVADMVACLPYRGGYAVGIEEFDDLDATDQAYRVLDVARRLTDDSPAGEASLVDDAAVHAIFDWVLSVIASEVETEQTGDPLRFTRTLVREAGEETNALPVDGLPDVASTDEAGWERCVGALERRVSDAARLDAVIRGEVAAVPETYFEGTLPEFDAPARADLDRFYRATVAHADAAFDRICGRRDAA